eukprot:403344521
MQSSQDQTLQSPLEINDKVIQQYQKLSGKFLMKYTNAIGIKSSYCSYILMGSPKDNQLPPYLSLYEYLSKQNQKIDQQNQNLNHQLNMSPEKLQQPSNLKRFNESHKLKEINNLNRRESQILIKPYRYEANKAYTMNTDLDEEHSSNYLGSGNNDSYGKMVSQFRRQYINPESQESNLTPSALNNDPNPEFTGSSVVLNTMSQGAILLDIKEGQSKGLIIVDPTKFIKQKGQQQLLISGMTLDSVKSNEEIADEGIQSIKTISRFKPDLSSSSGMKGCNIQDHKIPFQMTFNTHGEISTQDNTGNTLNNQRTPNKYGISNGSNLSNQSSNKCQKPALIKKLNFDEHKHVNNTFCYNNTGRDRFTNCQVPHQKQRTDTISGYIQDKYMQKNQKIIAVYEGYLNNLLSPQSKLQLEKKVSDIMNDS